MSTTETTETTDQLVMVATSELHPADDNLRSKMGDLKELARSIEAVGIQEPLVARFVDDVDAKPMLQLVAGHRRLAAAQVAKLTRVPVIVRDLTDDQATEIMLIENLQREDLSIVDEATGFFRLAEHGMTVKDLAMRVGRSQRHVKERLKLLELDEPALSMVDRGEFPIGMVGLASKLMGADEFADIDPERVPEILSDMATYPQRAERQVEDELKAVRRRRIIAELKEKAAKLPFELVESVPNEGARIGKSFGELHLDKRAHRKEECHAAWLYQGTAFAWGSEDAAKPKLIEICTDARRHRGANPASELVESGNDRVLEDREHEREKKAIAKAEAAEYAARLARAVTTGKKAALADAVAWWAIDRVADRTLTKVCTALSLEIIDGPHPWRENETEPSALATVKAYAAKNPTNLARAAFAAIALDDTWSANREHVDRVVAKFPTGEEPAGEEVA